MKISSLASSASLVALCLMLGACGGGGGIASTPTPPSSGDSGGTPTPSGTGGTPTPSGGGGTPTPTGTNSDLIAPLSSEAFKNNAAYGSISVPTGAGTTTKAAGQLALTFSYNASNGTYTVSDGTVSQSFSSSDKDATQSDSVQTTYVKTSKTTGDTFSLVNTGTGAGQTRYVGAGFLQHQVNGSSSIDGRSDAFTYGVETANASMPHSGAASFDVNLLGAYSLYSTIYALGGTGTLNVDFSNGALDVSGFYSLVDLINGGGVQSGMGWRGFGMVTSGTNDFTGKLNFDNIGDASLSGSFYGPAADEVGAVWWAMRDADNNTVGALYGARGSYPVNQSTGLKYPEHDTFFTPIANSVKANMDGSGILSNLSVGTALKAILVTQTSGTVVTYRSASEIYQPWNGGNSNWAANYEIYPDFLTYLRPGLQLVTGSGSEILDSFLFGRDTTSAQMPKSGSAHYSLSLHAGLLASGDSIQTIFGQGDLLADFGTGQVQADGYYSSYRVPADPLISGPPNSSPTDSGTWSGTAQFASSGFSGDMAFTGSVNNYSGTMQGQFYGPNADEVGAVLHLTGGGSQISGTIAGQLSDTPYGGNQTLAGLTTTTDLTGISHIAYISQYGGRLSDYSGDVNATYDPQAGTYDFVVSYNGGTAFDGPTDIALGPQDVDNSISDPGFTHYAKGDVSGRILDADPANPVINLTYMSFAQFDAPVQDSGATLNAQHFMYFGFATSPNRLPQSGTANYSGVVFGRGQDPALGGDISLGGTSTMSYNFGDKTFNATVNLTGTSAGGGPSTDLGSFDFVNWLNGYYGSQFSGHSTDNSVFYGNYSGEFFGPNAEEFGASFDVNLPNNTGQAANDVYFYGVTVGKQN